MNDEQPITVTVPNDKLATAIKAVTREKRTGKLLVNFSQGTPTGGVQWIEILPNGHPLLAVD